MITLILATAMLLYGGMLYAQPISIFPEDIQFSVQNEIAMNSSSSEFGVNEWKGLLCFTTNRNQFSSKNDYLGEASYTVVAFDEQRYRKVYPFEALMSYSNVGSVTPIKNDKFYFTAENNKTNYNLKEATQTSSMIIYEAESKEGKWKINPLRIIKDKRYSYIHPAISDDGRNLYFSSDIPEGFGGMDLYVCHLTDNGWSEPLNLGSKVNTTKNELFPFEHKSGMLFFASNGHRGFGEMDIFVTQKVEMDWMIPENMGSPINTPANDFSMYINSGFSNGYFSSDRDGGLGSDDIYNLSIRSPLSYNSNGENEISISSNLKTIALRSNYTNEINPLVSQ